MDHEIRIQMMREKILPRALLLNQGKTDRSISREVQQGYLTRIIPGYFMLRAHWDGLYGEERLLARTLVIAHLHRGREIVFSHYSAAALWGLPLYRHHAGRVHVYTPRERPGRSAGVVVRHAASLAQEQVESVAGIAVTSLSRTMVDLARLASTEVAVGVADAGLRKMFRSDHGRVDPAIEDWRGSQLELLDAMPRVRGVRSARKVLEFADPRADSVAESVSRLQFARLRVEVDIQVMVRGAEGRRYCLDFKFIGQAAFGEVDGRSKYTDEKLLNGQTPHERVLEEKRREDDIRGVTGDRLVRWMPEAIETADRLGRRMLAFGLRVPALE